MKPYKAILLTLHANEDLSNGSGAGDMPINRTAMQKLVYLESQKRLCDASYRAHYYGPYSEDVAEGLMTLWAFGYVREDAPNYDTRAYTYTLESGGRRLGKKLASGEHDKEYAVIRSIVNTCRTQCSLQQIKLSRAAKIHYLQNEHKMRTHDPAKFVTLGKQLGWELKKRDIGAGLKLLQALGLAN